MAFIQKNTPPKQDIRSFKVNRYEGGLNNVDSPFSIKENQSPDLLNVITFEIGAVETRPGSFKFITDVLGETIKKIFLYEKTGLSLFLLSSATKLYKINTTGGTITEVCSVSNVISGEQHDGLFYFVDGTKYRVYDGTNLYEITQPSTITGTSQAGGADTITLNTSASGTNDIYNGWEVYIVSGTGSGQTRTISDYVGATKVATVSSAWDTQPDHTSVYYITSTAQGVVTTVGAPTYTKTYSPTYLEFADVYKGANNITDILGCKRVLYHKSRFFFSNNATYPNTLFYTNVSTETGDLGQPNMYYVPSNQYSLVATDDADDVKGCVSFNDVLCIFKAKTIFALYGYDESDFDLKEISVAIGTVNIETVSQVNNKLFYLGSNGIVYSLYDVRTDYKKLLTVSVSDTIDLNKAPISVYDTDWNDSRAIFFDKYYILSISDKTLVYILDLGWVVWDNLNPTCFLKYNNNLLFTNSNKYIYRLPFKRFYLTETFTADPDQTDFVVEKGYLNELGTDADATVKVNSVAVSAQKVNNTTARITACTGGETVTIEYLSLIPYNDDGTSYEAYWESKDYDFGFPGFTKQFRRLYITANTYKYFTSKINFDLLIDYYEYSTGFTMKNQITLWGQAQFGDTFIDRNIVNSVPITINKRGKIVRFKVYNDQLDQPFKMYNIFGETIVRHK